MHTDKNSVASYKTHTDMAERTAHVHARHGSLHALEYCADERANDSVRQSREETHEAAVTHTNCSKQAR